MPTLSVVMIVKNEAGCLSACLGSVASIADEIVVGDTGSTDGTMDLARRFSARVFSFPWPDDFAAARNRVLAEAAGHWLLHMDADEMLDPAGARRIRELVDNDGEGADAVEVTLANYCDDPRSWLWTPVAPDAPMARGFSGYIAAPLLRLFRNGRGFGYRERVHENITESVLERGGVIKREPVLIHHYGYHGHRAPDPRKARFYLELGKRKVRDRPGDPKAWHDLAEQWLACGDAKQAEEACTRALELDPRHVGAATTLGNMLLNRGALADARRVLERIEGERPLPPHLAAALGAIACRQGKPEEARSRLERVIEAAPRTLFGYLYLARALDQLGDPAAARRHLEQAVELTPMLEEPRQRLEAHRLREEAHRRFESEGIEEALGALVGALRLDPEDPLIHNDLGVVASAMGDAERARECFNRALRLAPGMAEAEENLKALQEDE